MASYDKEDGIWSDAEDASMEVDDTVEVEALVEIQLRDGTVTDARILGQEIRIFGPSEWYYQRHPRTMPLRSCTAAGMAGTSSRDTESGSCPTLG